MTWQLLVNLCVAGRKRRQLVLLRGWTQRNGNFKSAWVVGEDGATSNGPGRRVDGRRHDPGLGSSPVRPLGVDDVAGDEAEEQVEDGHDGAELAGAARQLAGVEDGEDDDVEEDADHVDAEAEESGVVALLGMNHPEETKDEEEIVNQQGLSRPRGQRGPGNEQKMAQRHQLEAHFRHSRELDREHVVAHLLVILPAVMSVLFCCSVLSVVLNGLLF